MSPRTGRPKIDNPKLNDSKVRIDNDKYSRLLDYRSKNKTTKADTIRKGLDLVLQNKK